MHPFAPDDQTRATARCASSSKAGWRRSPASPPSRCSRTPVRRANTPACSRSAAITQSRGEAHRNVCLIPTSAHGTNPASAVMAGFRVVPVRCLDDGDIDLADLRAKADAHSKDLAALMVTYPSTHGVFETTIREICADRPRARRPGLHGRREHERAGRPLPPGRHRRGCLPSQSAQDVLHSARRRRPGHGPDRRRGSIWSHFSPASPPLTSNQEPITRRPVSAAPVRQREHPRHLVDVHPHDGRRRPDESDEGRDPQRQLHREAARPAFPGALQRQARPRRARMHPRSAPLQKRRRRSRGRGEAADGLRLSRADRFLAGAGHDHDRADRERIESTSSTVSATR